MPESTSTNTETQKDIETLDREAREALDRLADKREELQRELEATDLAEKRQREREQERRRAQVQEAERKAEEEAKARREKIAGEMNELEAEREELAGRIHEVLERYQELNWEMVQEVNRFDQERANGMAVAHVGMSRRWIEERFGV